MSETRVIVCGSRRWTDRQTIQDALFDITKSLGTCDLRIVHGAARGADRIAEQEAQKHGFMIEAHPADWSLGKRAGLIRNEKMAKAGAALCLAFWDGRSTGTADMIRRALMHGIPVQVIRSNSAAGRGQSAVSGTAPVQGEPERPAVHLTGGGSQ